MTDDKIELGELAFSGDDFHCDCGAEIGEACPPKCSSEISARRANRRLRERLAKAPKVYGFKGIRETVWHPHHVGGDADEARLVCIRKLEGT